MNDMDIEKQKLELFAVLMELETEIKILSTNIAKAQVDLANVRTMDDAKEFDENHDLEEGLKYIRLV